MRIEKRDLDYFVWMLLSQNIHVFPSARERILTNLKKHDAPQCALLLVPMKAPVPDISTGSLSDVHTSTTLIQEDLIKLQHQAK